MGTSPSPTSSSPSLLFWSQQVILSFCQHQHHFDCSCQLLYTLFYFFLIIISPQLVQSFFLFLLLKFCKFSFSLPVITSYPVYTFSVLSTLQLPLTTNPSKRSALFSFNLVVFLIRSFLIIVSCDLHKK